MKSVEEINAEYREAGWGKLAEHLGYNPYYMDDKAVAVVKDVYDRLNDPVEFHALRQAVVGKRVRQVLIAGQLYGPEEIAEIRQDIINLRDNALSMGAMEWAVLLSHVIGLLLCMQNIFDGDPVVLNGHKAYQEITK